MTQNRINKMKRQLQRARYSMVNRDDGANASIAAVLYHMNFIATDDVYRISTDGRNIYFNPSWLEKLGGIELEFILAHQLMHILDGHINRPKVYKGDRFHLGCDIIANAKLIDMGYEFIRLKGIGKIYFETYFPHRLYGTKVTPEEAFKLIPFDPATMPDAKRRQYMIDSDEWWDKDENYCTDGITVLSPEDKEPDYFELPDLITQIIKKRADYLLLPLRPSSGELDIIETDELGDLKNWYDNNKNEIENLRSEKQQPQLGGFSSFDERFWNLLRRPKLDWKKILNQFLQENIYDYSFVPPDKRFCDGDFILPDYNPVDFESKDILFMVDTSGSVNKTDLINVYSELCAASEQFNDKFVGQLGFFDTSVKGNIFPFVSIDDLYSLIPIGGGGTNFKCIFDYLNDFATDNIAALIIFTDGKGEYPKANLFEDLPVLWILSSRDETPPFGTVAYLR